MTTFKAFWHGPPLSRLHRAALRSFLAHGHSVILYSFSDLAVPAGVVLKDAAEVLPEAELFYFRNPQTDVPDLGPFSDVFRFKLLTDTGGWYVDVDTFCLSGDIPAYLHAWTRPSSSLMTSAVGTGQIAFPPGSVIARRLFEQARMASRTMRRREAIGPDLLGLHVRAAGLPVDMNGTPETYYPLEWIEIFKLWLPEFRDEVAELVQGALFLPYYQSLPRYMGFLDGGLPPAGSYLSDLLHEFGEAEDSGTEMSADDIRPMVQAWFAANAPWADAEYAAVHKTRSDDVVRGHGTDSVVNGGAPMSNLVQALGKIDESIMLLLRERERLIGEIADVQSNAAALAPFVVPFALEAKWEVRPFEAPVPGFWIGFPSDASPVVTLQQRADADHLLSPPDHHFTLSIALTDPANCPWMTIERQLDRISSPLGRSRLSVAMKAKATRPIDVKLEMSVPLTDGGEHRFPIGSVTITREYEATMVSKSLDLAEVSSPDTSRAPRLLAFLPTDAAVGVTLAYYTILLTSL